MDFPDTPNTVIKEMLLQENKKLWQKSWASFLEIYYETMRLMAKNAFARIGWIPPKSDFDDVVQEGVCSILDAFGKGRYQPDKYRFRGFLKRIIVRRVIDSVRSQNKHKTVNVESLNMLEALANRGEGGAEFFDALMDDEFNAYRKSILLDIWENIRVAYGPESVLIFEMRVLREMPVREICETLSVERAKVDKCIHRILKRIREECEKDFYRKELEK